MIVVFLALGTTDLIFALDSIPAIFGLTREPFIVFTANVFALMGLRQLYFLLGGLLKRLVYLSMGLAVILAFIGVKLVMEALHENQLPFINGGEHIEAVPEIPIWLSLTIILGVLVIATVASLLKTRGQFVERRRAGRRAGDGAFRADRRPRGGGGRRVADRRPGRRGHAPTSGRRVCRRARLASAVMRPTDLALLRIPGVPAVSPDGRMAVVAVTRPDLEADEYRSQLWAVPTDASAAARPLTSGHLDSAPAFSPDGRWIAYLSAEPGGRPQVWLLPTAGGAARRLTEHHLGAGAPVWSPDARRLAYVARVPEEGRYGTVDGVGPGAEPPRLITTLQYRLDDVGFLADRPSQVFVLDLPADFEDDTARAAGAGPGDHRRCRLRRRHLAPRRRRARVRLRPASARRPRPGPRRLRHRARRLRPAAGHRLPGRLRAAGLRPDRPDAVRHRRPRPGKDGVDFVARQAVPCRVDADGGPLEPLLDPEQHHRGDETPATVVADGGVLVGVQRKGAVELLRVPVDGGDAGGARRRGVHGARLRGRRRCRGRRRGPRPLRRRADRDHARVAAGC